tara:strand:+ start:548 stop:760 length:213 start_codon:yes stop_codon:yes gene_type:complete
MEKKTTKKAAPKAEPKKAKTAEIKLDHAKRYKLESNGTGPRMKIKGEILLNVGGASAENLVNNGFGKIIK